MLEKDWTTKAGLRAVVLTHPNMGHRMGYVAVGKESPAFGKDYDSDVLGGIDVHGGLTFAAEAGNYPVSAEGVWWLGYDCAHYGDLVPGLTYGMGGELRSLEYCERECESLAAQLAALHAEANA